MGDKSKIEWTDATWNPTTGCTKVSQGCKHCYAERLWPRLSAPGQPYEGRAFRDVACHPERLDQPLRWRKPRLVFVNSMSDLFHEAVPFPFVARVFGRMAEAEKHVFQVLTKRPERMLAFLQMAEQWLSLADVVADPDWDELSVVPGQWPLRNVWLGVSVEDQRTADERIPLLLQCPAAVRFISAEPLLGPVSLGAAKALPVYCEAQEVTERCGASGRVIDVRPGRGWVRHDGNMQPWIDWVICGGESGPGARPMHPDWARSLRDQCAAAGVAFFFKQWGAWGPRDNCADGMIVEEMHRVGKRAAGRLLDGVEHNEYPETRG